MTTENRYLRIVTDALDGLPVRPGRSAGADLLIDTGDATVAVTVKWAGEGWPEDVRRVAGDVPSPWPANLVLVARHLSPGAIEWLRERGANWADEAGQTRIVGPKGVIVIREPATARPRRSKRDFAWSPSAMSIAEAILAREDQPLRAASVAELTGWSVPQVAATLKSFDTQGWTAKRGPARGPSAHRELIDADAMLYAWSRALTGLPRKTRLAHRAGGDVMVFLRDELAPALDERVAWAASGWAALELRAPLMSSVPSLQVYVAEGDFTGPLSAAITVAGLREIDEGGRVEFWRADEHLLKLASSKDGVPVASAPRVFGDLMSIGGRGQDAAEHLKGELIDPLHRRAESPR